MINNILGVNENIRHSKGTLFDKTFEVHTKNTITSVSSDFSLVDYSASFKISSAPGSNPLYSKTSSDPELSISSNTFRINDKIDITAGKYYYELVITHDTEADKVYKIWYGIFYNER